MCAYTQVRHVGGYVQLLGLRTAPGTQQTMAEVLEELVALRAGRLTLVVGKLVADTTKGLLRAAQVGRCC